MSPFEAFYGRKSNRELNMLNVGEHTAPEHIEVEMEDSQECDILENDSLSTEAEVKQHMKKVEDKREEARKKSARISSQMVSRQVHKNPPSSYRIGEKVFVRVQQKGGVKRGGKPLSKPLVHVGEIVDVNRPTFKYKVQYRDFKKNSVCEFVSVNDITSLTRAEGKCRQERAQEEEGIYKSCMCLNEKCKRQPARGCRYSMNMVCCLKQGRNCHFHGIVCQHSKSQDFLKHKYDLSLPNELKRAFSDLSQDISLTLKVPKTQNEKHLDLNVRDAGLQYREPRTPADGNCLFHAIADQLHVHMNVVMSHKEVRGRIVRYLRDHECTSDGSHMRDWVANRSWESYLEELGQDGVWGDELTLIAASNIFSVEITIVSSIPGNSLRILTPANYKLRNTPMFLLGHLSESHYYSLTDHTQSVPTGQVQAKTNAKSETKNAKIRKSKRSAKSNAKETKVHSETPQLNATIASLVDQVKKMTRGDLLANIHVDYRGEFNEIYNPVDPVENNSVLLGQSDMTRYWAAHLAKSGHIIPVINEHLSVTDEEFTMFDEFKQDFEQYESERNIQVFYMDMALIFWLYTAGKLSLLRDSDSIDGSFILLQDEDADTFIEFRDALHAEWCRDRNIDQE